MKRKYGILLLFILLICLITIAVYVGIKSQKQVAAPKDDIEQTELEKEEDIMEDEIFEENDSNSNSANQGNSNAGSSNEGSSNEGSSDDNSELEKPIDDSIELPRVPFN